MSQVYSTEPSTTGRIILETSHGPLDVNLWCKECPSTTRAFLQLCIDGFYDNMVFHRIMGDFLIQTGHVRLGERADEGPSPSQVESYLRNCAASSLSAASASSEGSETRKNRKLELSPRIRFNHRGQLAMALPLDDDGGGDDDEDDNPLRHQFFVTLDECPFLDGKHVIFGTVTGPTIFNALRIGRTDVDADTNMPTDMQDSPPLVKAVKIDHHPFHDLAKTSERDVPWRRSSAPDGGGGAKDEPSDVKKRRKKRKGRRDFNVLSFGDEEREAFDGGGGMRSSHDVVSHESSFLSSAAREGVRRQTGAASADAVVSEEEGRASAPGGGRRKEDDRVDALSRDRQDHVHKRWRDDERHRPRVERGRHGGDTGVAAEIDNVSKVGREQSSKKHRHDRESKHDVSEVEARRAKYFRRAGRASSRDKSKREEDTMAKLFAFKSKVLNAKGKTQGADVGRGEDEGRKLSPANEVDNSLAARMAKSMEREEDKGGNAEAVGPSYHGQVLEGDSDDSHGNDGAGSGANWMSTKFKCRRHVDHESKDAAASSRTGGDGRSMDDYVVLDAKDRGTGDVGRHRGPRSQSQRDRGFRGQGDFGHSRERHRIRHHRGHK